MTEAASHGTERLPGGGSRHASWFLWTGTTLAILAVWLVADTTLARSAAVEEPARHCWRRAGGAIAERVLAWAVPG